MKKSIFSKVGAAAMVLTLVTASLVGGTFAKYTTNVTAKATVTAAKWNVVFTDGTDNITDSSNTVITLDPTDKTGKKEGTIIPGDSGSFNLVVNGKDAEADFEYTISLANGDGNNLDVKFYKKENDPTSEITSADPLKGTVKYDSAESKEIIVPVYWKLEEGADNAADTAMAGLTGNYVITLNATQKTRTAPVVQ